MLKREEFLAYGASIVYASIFGLTFLFTKTALEVADPIRLLSFRFLLAFLVLTILRLFKIIKVDYKGKNIKSLFILSMFQPVLSFIFETYGVEYSSTSYSGLIISLIPVVVTILAIWMLKEIPNKTQVIFILLSVAGVIYILLNDRTSESANTVIGTIFLLIAVLTISIYNILSRKNSIEFTTIEITYFMMGIGAIAFNGLSVAMSLVNGSITNYFEALIHTDFLIAILYLGAFSSTVGFFCMNYALSKLPASKAAVFSNLATVIAIVAGVVILNESFYFYHIIGSFLIISGIIGTNYFNTKSIEKIQETERVDQ